MRILTIIPARGGSKGIKLKNLVKINGKPLVAYSIEHSLASKLINRTIVSTDNEEIAKVSEEFGAEIPIFRTKELAGDHILDLPVFEHMLTYLKKEENYEPDIVVHLRPTCPYRKPQWIDSVINLLIENVSADSVRSVSEPSQHPYRVFEIKNKYLHPLMNERHPEPYLLRRQDLPKMYYYNCVIDVTKPNTIFNKKSMTGDKMLPYIMRSEDSIDIDTPMDLEFAKFFLKGSL
ncbi:MAG: acylneuraminate cytidylyltransferase family protein [Candidatus Marinimicrobia bacterium]|jgi:CMP-N,N'-diacetyllegionaminic acid synthase|nr:acylneuraminate cytidylyltransferase family protein [Candidatus Neomarinimicrobiota bacterium]MBT5996003.1 acylneuraminate cytidylyltransferase family protein [Candidatus Neomarinimicrobiota bacterium]MBT6471531.1 acylneuraminate cytidylyltransferase family protein [Candidatus Neomarinimicrobiota bacterium]